MAIARCDRKFLQSGTRLIGSLGLRRHFIIPSNASHTHLSTAWRGGVEGSGGISLLNTSHTHLSTACFAPPSGWNRGPRHWHTLSAHELARASKLGEIGQPERAHERLALGGLLARRVWGRTGRRGAGASRRDSRLDGRARDLRGTGRGFDATLRCRGNKLCHVGGAGRGL